MGYPDFPNSHRFKSRMRRIFSKHRESQSIEGKNPSVIHIKSNQPKRKLCSCMQNTRNACRNAHSAFNPLFVEMLLAEITYEPHCTSLQKFMLNIIFPMQMKTIYTFLREHNIFPHFLFYPLLPLTTSIMPSLTIFIPLRLRCISEFRTPLSLYFVPCSLHTSRIRGFPLSMTTNPTIYYTYTSSSLIQSVRMTNIDETHTESMNFIRCHYILLTKLCVGLLDE